MKRRLNILFVIVLLVLGYSVLETTYYVGLGIKTGIEKGFDLDCPFVCRLDNRHRAGRKIP
jgi:hypothetical protein